MSCKMLAKEFNCEFALWIGRLSGVMDDRGKYIYISQEEMKAVADYIKCQGRVSISHLASKSNQFIDLETKAQFVEDLSSVEEISVAWLQVCPQFMSHTYRVWTQNKYGKEWKNSVNSRVDSHDRLLKILQKDDRKLNCIFLSFFFFFLSSWY